MVIKQKAILLRFPEFSEIIVRQINENEDLKVYVPIMSCAWMCLLHLRKRTN
jgi:hypothetical protein